MAKGPSQLVQNKLNDDHRSFAPRLRLLTGVKRAPGRGRMCWARAGAAVDMRSAPRSMGIGAIRATLAAGLLLTAAAAPVSAADAETERLATEGGRIVAGKCARCHAIERSGSSALAAAPPFRTLPAKYPIEALAEAFAEGITTGHPEMPEFIFSTGEIAAILAYIDQLVAPPAATR